MKNETDTESGVGAAVVRSLAARGADVCFNYTSESSVAKSEALVKEIQEQHGTKAICVRADITQPDAVAKIVEAAKSAFTSSLSGGFQIDIVINNAGVGPSALLPDVTTQSFHETYTVNVLGPILVMQAVLPYLPHDRSGRVINISSIAANIGILGYTIYGGSKAALDAMTRTWSRELSERATVNSLNLGPVLTEMQPASYQAEEVALWNQLTPLAAIRDTDTDAMKAVAKALGGRVAYDYEIADAVALHCMPEAGWTTGMVVGVNGGFDFIR